MIPGSSDAFDKALILSGLNLGARSVLAGLEVLEEVGSTNNVILEMPPGQRHAYAVLADQQTVGRGRRKRSWHSPPGGNIYLSLGWQFDKPRWPLSTLPLVVALAVCQALDLAGLSSQGIKWPNDILSGGKKLAGILVEMQSAGTGPALAVVGVGLNVRMPGQDANQLAAAIDRPWTDLCSELGPDSAAVNRNDLATVLLNELFETIAIFEKFGFEVFRPAWAERDVLRGRTISLDCNTRQLTGCAVGVDRDGGLLLETATEGVRVFHSGEVSVHRE
jgi:BirA family biotin operon repressor/biotin-[acetyl-CoA-carboxylase] ligase